MLVILFFVTVRAAWEFTMETRRPAWIAFCSMLPLLSTRGQKNRPRQRRALYGPMPVKTETFSELWAPLVHTNFGGNSYGPIIGPYLFLGKFVWTNGPESSSKVSPYTGIGPWMALPSKKKTNSWERRFPGTFRTSVPLILPIFSVFSVGGGPKVPRNFVPGNFFFLF